MSKITSFREWIEYEYDCKSLLEMANIQPHESGLKYGVNVLSRAGEKHGARVKVSNIPGRYAHEDNFVVTLEANPRVIGTSKIKSEHLNDILDWVKLNHEHIHKVWNDKGTMSASDITNGLKKLGA
jgi:hypothetical protein